MKIIAACLLALSVAGCSAQTQRVNNAFSLYKSCFQGTILGAARGQAFPANLAELRELVKETDTICEDWTIIWFPEFHDESLTLFEFTALIKLRKEYTTALVSEFAMLYNLK